MIDKIGNIGFMQGRLSPPVDGKIQSFPQENWMTEFSLAKENNFSLMEWTLDLEHLFDNPFLTHDGQSKILKLSKKYNLSIKSLTGDCFMQAPFYKKRGKERDKLVGHLISIIQAASEVGCQYVIIPLVDNGSLENENQEDILLKVVISIEKILH